MLTGFQLPNIITAKAKNPYPATDDWKPAPAAIVYAIPPIPPKIPEIITPAYLILYTFIPTDAAACGCSPQARNLNPNFVLYNIIIDINSITNAIGVVKYRLLKIKLCQKPVPSASPKVLSVILIQVGIFITVFPCPWIAHESTTAKAGASIFNAVPPIVWSAFRFIAAKASSKEKTAPAKAEIPIVISIAIIGWAGPKPDRLNVLSTKHPISAPIIIIPSSAIFITPLLSENIPPSATSIKGIANIIVEPNISPSISIVIYFAPPFCSFSIFISSSLCFLLNIFSINNLIRNENALK